LRQYNLLVRDLLTAVEQVRPMPELPPRVRMVIDANLHFVLLHSTAHEGWREGIELRARGGTIVGWWLDHPVETAWRCRACGQDHDEQTYLCGGVVVAGGAVYAGVQPPYGAPVGGGGAAVAARAGGGKARGTVTVMQYYAYRLMFRGATSAGAYLHRARRLFQEWLE
jgi:hypothetical protein